MSKVHPCLPRKLTEAGWRRGKERLKVKEELNETGGEHLPRLSDLRLRGSCAFCVHTPVRC